MINFLVSTIALGVVFLYGCVGEIITEKAGHLNLGIPGIMCLGTAGGAVGVAIYMNSLPDANSARLYQKSSKISVFWLRASLTAYF